MTKEEARLKLREAQDNLRQAEIILEMHENGVREIKEDIVVLQEIINKKDDWRDKLTKGDYAVGATEDGLSPWFGIHIKKAEHTFKEKEQAQLLAHKMNLMQEMYAFAHVKNEGWVPDWESGHIERYGVFHEKYGVFKVRVRSRTTYNAFVFGVSVKSEAIAKEMLEEFGERIEEIYNKQY